MTEMVTVACSLPNGLIIEEFREEDAIEPNPMGGRPVKIWRRTGKRYKIPGAALQPPGSVRQNAPMMSGYALKRIPKSVWEHFVKLNHDADVLKSGCLFAHVDHHQVGDQAIEQQREGFKTGFDPLDPKNLPKGMIPPRFNIEVETADEQMLKPEFMADPRERSDNGNGRIRPKNGRTRPRSRDDE